jgi:putative ABC transport system ATP-binding protein
VSALSGFQLAGIRNQKIGFVFQTFNLLAKATLQRNVELPLLYAGSRRRAQGARPQSTRARRPRDRAKHRPAELSGGSASARRSRARS